MIKKKPVRGTPNVSVTFRQELEAPADSVELLGDFNDWTLGRHALKQRKDGNWSVTVRLPQDRTFQYRYLVDGQHWVTDPQADGVARNEFGGLNTRLDT